MIAQFQFGYGPDLPTPEQVAALQVLVRETVEPEHGLSYHTYTGDVAKVMALFPGVPVSLQVPDITPTLWESITEKLDRILAKTAEGGTQFNEKCAVVVPGLGLLAVNEVQVLYDYCTEDLQRFLTDGWRILAVCPQPTQRRPDYVLGRTKPHDT
jgi:hypothetical protein